MFEILSNQFKDIFKVMVYHSPITIVILNRNGEIIFANPAFHKFTGYESNDVKSKSVFELIREEDHNLVKEKIQLALSGEIIEEIEYKFKIRDNTYLDLTTDAVPIKNEQGKVISILTMTQDMTEINLDKNKLKESEELYRNIIQMSPNAIYLHAKGRILYANPKGLQLARVETIDELTKIPIIDFVHPDYKEIAINRIRTLEVEKRPIEALREKFVVLDGSVIDVEVIGQPITFRGKPANLVIVRDLSMQIRDEQRLKESEARKSAIFSAIPDLMFVLNGKGEILDFNAPDLSQLFISSEKVIGTNILTILPEEDAMDILTCINQTLNSKELSIFEYQLPMPSGIESYEARFVYSSENEVLAIVRNITKKKVAQEEEIRTLRIQSVGLLAGGIAHDFNNILMRILGNTNLMQLESDLPKKLLKSLNEIENATLRASELTNQLLTFSKGGDPVTKPESIKELIEDSVSFILSGSKSKVIMNYSEDLITVEVEAGQIYQLINNIVINADQSMPEGGIIEIGLKIVTLKLEELPGIKGGKYVKISILDHGNGIEEELMDKIFEPYYTTKAEGSGLGLPTCYSIVKRHHGHIMVESEVDKGSIFVIHLPISQKHKIEEKKDLSIEKTFSGKVLIMEDNPNIQITLSLMLKHLGFECETSKDGQEAIHKYSRAMEDNPFTLVIMDLTIPGGMSGIKAMEEILKIDPKVNSIVSSGYSNDPVMANYKDYGFKDILSKPYTLDHLKKVIAGVLSPQNINK